MPGLDGGLSYIDLRYLGMPSVIATAVLPGRDGVALVDPGPTASVAALRDGLAAAGLSVGDVTDLLLTHIHLDHAGATGTLVAENPRIRVHVHERGARHVIDPQKLLDSARRLYGDAMERILGACLPVPAGNVHALAGGERLDLGGRALEVAYTPGHASHHVSYLEPASGIAFVGDTAGGRIGTAGYVMPPTPPPDIDLELWQASADRILAWQPRQLFLTHFGPSPIDPATHLHELMDRLHRIAGYAKAALDREAPDEVQAAHFRDEMRAELRRHMSEAEAQAYELAIPLDHCFLGLARYWRKKLQGGA